MAVEDVSFSLKYKHVDSQMEFFIIIEIWVIHVFLNYKVAIIL